MPIKNSNDKNNMREIDFESLENFKKFLNEHRSVMEGNINNTKNIENKENKKIIGQKKPDLPMENYDIYDQNFPLDEEEFVNKEFFHEQDEDNDENIKKTKDNIKRNENNNEVDDEDQENYAEEVKLNVKKFQNNLSRERINVKDLFQNKYIPKEERKTRENPLLIYRDPGISIKIPSMGKFYHNGEIVLEPNGQVNVFPMTIRDEIYLRSPDFLLNGSAIEKIIESCVPSVKDPKKILVNDIIALLVGIKWASGSNVLSYSSVCPNCKSTNKFDIQTSYLFDEMVFLKDEYVIDINNVQVYVRPFDYEMVVKNANISFEESKTVQILTENNDIPEEEKLSIAKKSLERLQEITFYSVLNSIEKVVIKNQNITVTDKEMISEWLSSIKLKDFNRIKDLINEINLIGLPTEVEVKCRSCKFKYNLEIKYDPSDFLE